MPLQHYVSAEWVTDPVMGTQTIKAIGDDDSIWWIPAFECDIPPWPEFLETEAGRTFAASAPSETKPAESPA